MSYLTDVSKKMAKQKNFNQNEAPINSLNTAKSKLNDQKLNNQAQLEAKNVSNLGKTRRKKYIQAAMTSKLNTTTNARAGKYYFEEATKGGSWHVYDNGRRVFVPKHGTTTLPNKKQTGGTYKYLRSNSA